MARNSRDLSVAELERLLDRRKSKLSNLNKKRDSLQKQLTNVETQIVALEGKPTDGRKRGRRSRKRPKNEKPLQEVVSDVLRRTKRGYTLSDLSEKVLEAGYKSNSTDFKNVLYQCIYKAEEIVHDEETGRYRLA